MPLQPADMITLLDDERKFLEALVRAHTTPKQIVTRARIILLADAGLGVNASVRELGTWDNIVRRWRKRWNSRPANDDVAMRLADEPRSGAPAKYTPEIICLIIALACEQPGDEEGGPPITHWSQQQLADEAVRRGIVKEISQGSVGRFLKRIRPQATSDPLLAEQKA